VLSQPHSAPVVNDNRKKYVYIVEASMSAPVAARPCILCPLTAMTMFNPIPTSSTLLTSILIGYIVSTRAEVPSCFYPNGSLALSDYACNLTAEASFCCAIGFNCLDNKICTAEGEGPQWYNRGSCTDKNWDSPDCPQFCKNFSPGGGSFVVNCHRWEGDTGVCCYDTSAAEPNDCCSKNSSTKNPIFTLDGSATPFTFISSEAATQTRILPSSSSTTATTTALTSSTSSPVVDSSSSPTPSAASDPPPSSDLKTGAYVGIAVGIAAAIALLCAATYLFRKRRRSNRQHSHSPMMSLVAAPPWNNNNNSPGFPYGKEQGNVYEHRTSEVAELNELAAGDDRRPELRGETLLELEGDHRRR